MLTPVFVRQSNVPLIMLDSYSNKKTFLHLALKRNAACSYVFDAFLHFAAFYFVF